MFLLRKPQYSKSILTVTARLFTTQIFPIDSSPAKPTAADYDLLVNAAGESRDFTNLHHLLTKRVKDRCCNTNNTFNFITNTEASLSVIPDLLSETLARLDKGYTRKSAYDSLIFRLCKLERVEEALRVVELMAREDYGLNADSFHPILNVLTKKARMEEAWRVMELMRQSGAPPDLVSYNYFLKAYCLAGDLAQAAGILSTIEEEGMTANTRTYHALLMGACTAGKMEGVMVLLRRMVDDGVPVMLFYHVCVVDSLVNRGFYEQAVKFMRGFSGKDTWLDTEGFRRLAMLLIKRKRFAEAKEVLDEMREMGLDIGDKLEFYDSKITKKNVNKGKTRITVKTNEH